MQTNILALDLGKSSLGLAISQSGMFVTPLPNLHFKAEDYDECLRLLAKVTKDMDVEHLVIGLPLYPSGDECEMTPIVKAFIPRLEALFPGIDINLQDERNTTVEASSMLHLNNKKAKKQKPIIDSAAAMIILERYLRTLKQI